MLPEGVVWPPRASRPIGQCRRIHVTGTRIHQDIITDHPGTLGTVTRPVPVRVVQLARLTRAALILADGRLSGADRSLDSSLVTGHPPWTYLGLARAKYRSASDKLASPFDGWTHGVHADIGYVLGRPELGKKNPGHFVTLSKSCCSHLDASGEPSSATWDPQGRPPRRPTPPRRRRTAPTDLPARERG